MDGGPSDHAPDRSWEDRRRCVDEPSRDPQAARGGRGLCGRGRPRLPRAEEGERRESRVGVRRQAGRERVLERRLRRRRGARRDGVALLRSRLRRHARLPVRRRGRPGVARGCGGDVDLRAERRARRRPAAARPGAAGLASDGDGGVGAGAPARRRGDGAARPRAVSRAHLPATSGRVRVHLGGVLRGAPAA